MSKFHLIQSQTPLSEGRDQDAMCGKTVLRAVFCPLTIDRQTAHPADLLDLLQNIQICRKCFFQKWTDRYIYAAKAGDDEHQSDSSLSD